MTYDREKDIEGMVVAALATMEPIIGAPEHHERLRKNRELHVRSVVTAAYDACEAVRLWNEYRVREIIAIRTNTMPPAMTHADEALDAIRQEGKEPR